MKKVFIEYSRVSQDELEQAYLDGNYSPYVCSVCGQEPFWMGKSMPLVVHHKNKRKKDNRLENLCWVCANCDSQLNPEKYI